MAHKWHCIWRQIEMICDWNVIDWTKVYQSSVFECNFSTLKNNTGTNGNWNQGLPTKLPWGTHSTDMLKMSYNKRCPTTKDDVLNTLLRRVFSQGACKRSHSHSSICGRLEAAQSARNRRHVRCVPGTTHSETSNLLCSQAHQGLYLGSQTPQEWCLLPVYSFRVAVVWDNQDKWRPKGHRYNSDASRLGSRSSWAHPSST